MIKKLLLFAVFTIFINVNLFGQCANTESYGSAYAPTDSNTVTINTCQYQGDYVTVFDIVAGETYEITNSCGGYITVRSGAPGGPVVGSGNAPFTFTATANGNHFIHFNSNASCGTSSFCCTTAISCTSCTPPPLECGDTFYDSGGAGGDYSDSENIYTTLTPNTPNTAVVATFTAFEIENNYDFLYIYDGPNNTFPLIGIPYTGTNSPGTVTSSHPSGALTFVFESDLYLTNEGWVANITCISVSLPATNDECSGAIPLSPSSICNYSFYDNTNATDSAGVPAPGCAFYSGGDVWFSVLVDSIGEVTIDTETAAVTDSGMALYSGTCGALTLIECDDDGSGNGAMSLITLTNRTPGETIYIRFWEYGNDNQGTFGICATSSIPPNVYSVSLTCPGDASEPLTSTVGCQGALSIGNTINGSLNAATDNVALQPLIFISSADPCQFDATDTSNYTTINFTVDTTGTYSFVMEVPVPYFDAMGYIFETTSGFVPGTCSAGYIAGDDDDGPALNPLITAVLTAGFTYTLVTTKFNSSNTTHSGPFTWTVTGPPGDVDWYTTATGGTPIGFGASFDPVGVASSPLTDTNTPGIYSFWGACPSTPGIRLQADYIIGKIWNGSIDTNWYDDNNWTPNGVPSSTNCVVIPDPTQSNGNSPVSDIVNLIPFPPQPAFANNLTIQNGGYLEIEENTSIEVLGFVNIAPNGTLLLRDSASLIQVTEGAANTNNNTGAIHMQRSVTGLSTYDYVYWSSPVENFNVAQISPNTNANAIWKWLPTQAAGGGIGNHGDWRNATTNEAMIVGQGYIVRDLGGATVIPPALPANTTEFIGRPNNGILTFSISRGTHTTAAGNYTGESGILNATTPQDDNWNLVGNPYPSAISYGDFINANSTIDGTIHLWKHQSVPTAIPSPFYQDFGFNYSDDYIDNNYSGSNPPGFNGNIAAGQSFFVQMLETTPSTTEDLIFNNGMRSPSNDNSQFYRQASSASQQNYTPVERHRIWLDLLTSDNIATSTLVGYIEGATNQKDRLYDGYDFEGASVSFYSLIADEKMAIQGRALPFLDSDIVPMGMILQQSGMFTIAINSIDGLFATTNQAIYIEDTYSNTIHNLRTMPYTFTSESGTFNDRFILRYRDSTLGIDEFKALNLNITAPNGDYIKITSDNNPIKSIQVYDLLGRVLLDKTNVNTIKFIIENDNLSEGTYIVKATLENNKFKIQKIILKQ